MLHLKTEDQTADWTGEPFMITNLFIIISGARIFLLQKILELLQEPVKAQCKELSQLYHSPTRSTKRVMENTHYLKTRTYKWQTVKL
ncbi:hypothetical protein E4O03_07715 [Treponema sp. OMZ 792]|uniref:hypothetical protein n=1 Tax=unclassified Treponema TaxID=2638727 RepID=UPI0020A423C4|nr:MULTISPECIES: hypothetical protein [unclassified Treponema]UTC74134.1 hypothetical protein E4O03_07715 [Treponema sp. OMZ 792]UTC80533.1 hypothetical protein E4O07_07615 [Treponema sp. OMZ 798]